MRRKPLKLKLTRIAGAAVDHLAIGVYGRTFCGIPSRLGGPVVAAKPLCRVCAKRLTHEDTRGLYLLCRRP